MLAFIYLFICFVFGDILCRRFFRFDSLLHRFATAFLVGTFFSAAVTFLLAVVFSESESSNFWANITWLGVVAVSAFVAVKFFEPVDDFLSGLHTAQRPPGNWRWDALVLGVCMAFAIVVMFAMLAYDGEIKFSIGTWSDFGANLSVAQSFAFGDNYPAEHPFFPGEPLKYHFLFWYLAGNLSYLGLNIVWAVNIVSLLSLFSLLVLMMTLSEKLFHSRAIGRLSLLFFFLASSSLSYFHLFTSGNSFAETIAGIISRKVPLISGFPYHGDGWGSLSVISFMNQRHLIAASGIFLIVLIHVLDFYRRKGALASTAEQLEADAYAGTHSTRSDIAAMMFCGVVIGLLPYLNSAVLISAALVFGALFLLFPHRRLLLPLLLVSILVGVPQLLLLRSGNVASMSESFHNWGYIVADPTFGKLVEYLLWTFGFKWLVLLIAVIWSRRSHRLLILALFTPFIAAFSFQFSVTMINNHKLLNIWGILVAPFVAYGIWVVARRGYRWSVLAAALLLLMVFGAVVDLFPIRNDGYVTTPYGSDRLTTWVLDNTKPGDIFLTEMWLSHPILFAGRKIFFGNTLFAWSAGYGNLPIRDKAYKEILKTIDPARLTALLRENDIDYIAVDNGFRRNENSRYLNEQMLRDHFALAFDDVENKYGNLKIYRIP